MLCIGRKGDKTTLKKIISTVISAILIPGLLCGCAQDAQKKPAASSDKEQTVITIAGPWEESSAIEALSADFTKANPNCRVEYEYVQNYYDSLEKRLAQSDSGIDLFVTTNLQSKSPLKPYALELFSQKDKLDLSGTFEGLIQNFTYMDTDKTAAAQIYAVPFGAEIRGLYVNKTLLSSLGIAVPENRTQLLNACEKLKQAGYTPFQGNPGSFGQWLMYPYICNMIANSADYSKIYARINSREAGISEFFREPMQFVYDIVAKDYYNYKAVENKYGFFTDGGIDVSARAFLNITGTDGNYKKTDDTGVVAFMPGPMSMDNTISKLKDDYHSGIDYEFILAPTGDDGGYAYMSPSDGIAVNKNSKHIDLALKYMNFLFTPQNNKAFAQNDNITPNTSDAFEQIKGKFKISDDHISQLGKVTFDYAFYSVINETIIEISKSNNPKYMIDNGNGTYSMYPFEHYMENFEARFQKK